MCDKTEKTVQTAPFCPQNDKKTPKGCDFGVKYRDLAGGGFAVPTDGEMAYPRLCAHRGFNAVCPENSLPAFGSAVALGAGEIEFDVWATSDGVLVSTHDSSLARTSDGQGKVWEHTFDELKTLDFGVKKGEGFKGLRIVTFEEILRRFSRRCIMNIHVKIWDKEFERRYYREIGDLIEKYGATEYVYVMSHSSVCLEEFHALYPSVHRCKGYSDDGYVDDAIRLGVEKVQLFKPHFDQAMIDKAHDAGLKCNVFYADDVDEARAFLEMGIDTVLTNDYLRIKNGTLDLIPWKE